MAQASDTAALIEALRAEQAPAEDFSASLGIEKILEKILTVVESLQGSIKSGINLQLPQAALRETFSKLINSIKNLTPAGADPARTPFGPPRPASLPPTAPDTGFAAVSGIKSVLDKLLNAIDGLKNSFKTGISITISTINLKNLFQNPFKNLGDKISNQFNKFKDAIKAPFRKLGDAITAPFKKVGQSIAKFFGFGKKTPEEKTADASRKTYRLLLKTIRPLIKNIRDDIRALKKSGLKGGDKGGGVGKGKSFGKKATDALSGIGKGLGKGMEAILKGFSSGLKSMGDSKVLKGILNLGLLGVSLVPFALALKLFTGIRFDKVLIGIGALVAIAGIARILGDPTISTFIFIGAAAIGALGLALIPFGFGLDLVAGAAEKMIPVLEAVGDTFLKVIRPAVEVAQMAFNAFSDTISTIGGVVQEVFEVIGDTIQESFESIEGIVSTMGDVLKKPFEVLDNIAKTIGETITGSFDRAIEMIKFLEETTLTGAKLLGIAGGIGSLAAALAGFAAADLGSAFGFAISGVLDFFSGRIGNIELLGILTAMSDETTGIDSLSNSISNLQKELSKLSQVRYDDSFVDFLEDLRDALNDKIKLSSGIFGKGLAVFAGEKVSVFSGLMKLVESSEPMRVFAEAVDLAASAITKLSSALASFTSENFNDFMDTFEGRDFTAFNQGNAIQPFTRAAVGETAVGLATGAEAAATAAVASVAPVINNVVTNSTAPTQIVPDSNIGSRSTDRDVFSPLDNCSPYKFSCI